MTENTDQPTETESGGGFDWLDAVLITLSFASWLSIGLGIMKLGVLSESLVHVVLNFGSLFVVGGPVVLRRLFWGSPDLPPARFPILKVLKDQ